MEVLPTCLYLFVVNVCYKKLEKLMMPDLAEMSLQETTSKSKIRMPAVGNAAGSGWTDRFDALYVISGLCATTRRLSPMAFEAMQSMNSCVV